jgi:hypothetical protein
MGRVAARVSKEVLDVVLQKFNSMPEKAGAASLTLNDAFFSLKPAISDMQKKGYSLNEILDLLRESGVSVGMTKLKEVISKPRKKRVVVADIKNPPPQKPIIHKTPAVQDPDEK